MKKRDELEAICAALMLPSLIANKGPCALGLMDDNTLVEFARSLACRILDKSGTKPAEIRDRARAVWIANRELHKKENQ